MNLISQNKIPIKLKNSTGIDIGLYQEINNTKYKLPPNINIAFVGLNHKHSTLPSHQHDIESFIILLQGTLQILQSNKQIPPFSHIYIPKKAWHGFKKIKTEIFMGIAFQILNNKIEPSLSFNNMKNAISTKKIKIFHPTKNFSLSSNKIIFSHKHYNTSLINIKKDNTVFLKLSYGIIIMEKKSNIIISDTLKKKTNFSFTDNTIITLENEEISLQNKKEKELSFYIIYLTKNSLIYFYHNKRL